MHSETTSKKSDNQIVDPGSNRNERHVDAKPEGSNETLGLLLALLAAACSNQATPITTQKNGDPLTNTISRTFDVTAGGSLNLTTNVGNITVTAWNKNVLSLRITRRVRKRSASEAKRALSDFPLKTDQSADVVTVSARSGDTNWLSINFEISVPTDYNVDLDTKGGNIKVGDLVGEAAVRTSVGNISVGTITGGLVTARTSGGNIRAGDVIGGSLDVHTSGGNITIANVSKTARAKTSGGNIRLGDVAGDTDIHTSGGNIHVARIGGVLKAGTSGGNISIGETGGDLVVKTSGGNITLGPGGGIVQAHTSGGNIHSGGSIGPIDVNTSGGNITIKDAKGSVQAHTSGGNIQAELNYPKRVLDEPCEIRSAGGSITVMLPAKLGARIDATIRLRRPKKDYRITTDFDLDVKRESARITANKDVNGGGAKISITTTNGDIKILKI
jgi:DUF4097 and DUF4098 domain-containing protein YvlB